MQRGRKPNQRYLNTSKCFTIENIGTVILINLARWCLKSYKVEVNKRLVKRVKSTVELDESYFGGAHKGKRGRGAAGKVAVFGILRRGGKVYTKVVNDTKAITLMPLITRKIAPDSVYPDCYRSYHALDVR